MELFLENADKDTKLPVWVQVGLRHLIKRIDIHTIVTKKQELLRKQK